MAMYDLQLTSHIHCSAILLVTTRGKYPDKRLVDNC